ncbi:hypothetical protein HAP94_01580 [Acidithiobacillus ferrivorans]|nr:hypothetical protein [Acidithiobacillus ferrivorans]
MPVAAGKALAATGNTETGNTEAEQSPARIYAIPQIAIVLPKNQEVDHLATDDLLGEADVYWTYGKWHDAMQIYEWWISSNGTGPTLAGSDRNEVALHAVALQAVALQAVARKYLDCAAKAMDFDAFYRMMRKLIDLQVEQAFLQDMVVFGLMRDPGNFDLIGLAEVVEVEESRIISIAQKVVNAEKTPGQRKSDLWKRNRNDAGRLAAGGLAAGWLAADGLAAVAAEGTYTNHGSGCALVVATSAKDYQDMLGFGSHQARALSARALSAQLFGILCGADFLDDSAAVVDHWKIESVMAHLRREMESRPMKLTVYVDYLRIAHGEGLRDEYAEALLALFSVLLSANAGSGLRRRLLASGRLLGHHWIFDFLSGSQGREFMAVAHKVRDCRQSACGASAADMQARRLQATTSVYVPEKAWAKSPEWSLPLVLEKEQLTDA